MVQSVVIGPSERYVVDVHIPEAGEVEITNSVQAIDHFRGLFFPEVTPLATVVVGEGGAAPLGNGVVTGVAQGADDHGAAFRTLSSDADVEADRARLREHFTRAPDHTLVATMRHRNLPNAIVLSMEIDTLYVPPMEWNDAMPEMNWLSTGKQVEWILREEETGREGGEIDWDFRVGDLVKIRVFNDPRSFHPMNHPIHLHGQRFLVVARDGVVQENLVWKDTAIVPTGSTMDLLVEMSNPGDWMIHCHIAEHLHTGMHFHFSVAER